AEQAGDAVDLGPSVEAAERLVGETERLNGLVRSAGASPDGPTTERLNTCLMRLARLLVPLDYCELSPYEHDLALPLPAVPALRGANGIGRLGRSGDDFRHVRARPSKRGARRATVRGAAARAGAGVRVETEPAHREESR